jgi:hypothetical protein
MADASWKGKVCPQGHKCLTRHFVREGMHSCDECAEIIGADTTGGRCRVCDFDICQICFNKPAVTDVRVRDLITDVVLPPVRAPPVLTVNVEPPLQMFPIFGRRFMPAEHVIEISDDSDNDIPAVLETTNNGNQDAVQPLAVEPPSLQVESGPSVSDLVLEPPTLQFESGPSVSDLVLEPPTLQFESVPSVSDLVRPIGRLNLRRSGPTATTQTDKPATMRSVETQSDRSEPVTLDDIKALGLVTLEDVRRELWALLRN